MCRAALVPGRAEHDRQRRLARVRGRRAQRQRDQAGPWCWRGLHLRGLRSQGAPTLPQPNPHPHTHTHTHTRPHPHPRPDRHPDRRLTLTLTPTLAQAKSAAEKLKDALGEAGGRKGCDDHNVVRDNALLRGSIDMIAQAGGGGGCTCPDGQVYQVGSIDASAASTASRASTRSPRSRASAAWPARTTRAPRARAPRRAVRRVQGVRRPVHERLHQHDETAGEYGGHCLCPNGRIFAVGSKVNPDPMNPDPSPSPNP